MKKRIIILVAVIVIVVAGVIGYIATSQMRQESILRKEAQKLSEMDITKDNVDMEIKTTGDYAIVEKTMKDYIYKYSETLKELGKILEDDKLQKVLTSDNYKEDGPDFVETRQYISDTRTNFNDKINTIIDMTKEENMLAAIEGKNLDEVYINLYKELMLGKEMTDELKEAENSLEESKTTINKLLDVQENIIDMLIKNKGRWEVNAEGEVQFESQKLVDEYNGYLNNL